MPTITALDVAAYLVELASKCDENDLTNLKLQKLLYFIQAEYYTSHRRTFFTDEIEAWAYGPVVRSVYNAYKSCGAFPITAFDLRKTINTKKLTRIQKEFVDRMWEKWGIYSAYYLINQTHKKDSPWYKHYHSEDKVIPLNELRVN